MSIVAYQGEPGSYSEEACTVVFPGGSYLPQTSFRRVFESVEVGRADYGLVALENSQAGSINETYDLFLRHGLHLVGETILRVDHCLLGLPGTSIDDLTEVISHPQALAQCEEFVSSLGVAVHADYDTAGSAKRIADDKLAFTASIASRRAALLYNLEVLA